jgi:hypothetical protein
MKFGWGVVIVCAVMALAFVQPALGQGLEVTVGADTSFVRMWSWTIDKSSDTTALTLHLGEEADVTYTVTLGATSEDGDFEVSGDISILNNSAAPINITGVSAIISPAIAADVDCGVTFPMSLGAGDTLACTYSADLPDASTRTVTVNVTGDSPASGFATANFAGADMTEIDECVGVVDSWHGSLGVHCAADAPIVLEYTRTLPSCIICGTRPVTNIVTFTTNDTQAIGSDTWTICLTLICEDGCTRTPGYWKTHSEFGSAPFDNTWEDLPDGAATDFFLSGQIYYEVLSTPRRGNAYYILAFQWIGARLNMLAGTSAPDEVLDAFDDAQELFETYTPSQIGALSGGSSLRRQFIGLAEILADYNEGEIGPGHCN